MSLVHLDTHVVLWLYEDPSRFIPASVLTVLRRSALSISPMVLLELGFLHEIGRIAPTADVVLSSLTSTVGLAVDPTPFAKTVEAAIAVTWTRDPFDRLIVAQAMAADVQLMTADRQILAQSPIARWAPDPAGT